MNSRLLKSILNPLKAMLVIVCVFSSNFVSAAMNADSELSFVLAPGGSGTTQPASGSWFSMEQTVGNFFYTPISSLEGIKLGKTQVSSASHFGNPDGSERATIDNPWGFFSSTGMHGTITTPVTVVTDDGAGNVTFDMAGWFVDWNGGSIPMGSGADAIVTCGNTCEYGDTYTFDYSAIVPSGIFTNVPYAIHLEGTIGQQPSPNTAPVAVVDNFVVDQKVTGLPYTPPVVDILVNDTDADGFSDIDVTSVIIVSNVTHGTTVLDGATGNIEYTPDDDYTGTDSLTYTVDDLSANRSNVATANIIVATPLPFAVSDTSAVDISMNLSVDIAVLDNDIERAFPIEPSSVLVGPGVVGGATSVSVTGVVTYTPTPGFIGTGSFTYTMEDTNGGLSNSATVTASVFDSTISGLPSPAFFIMDTGALVGGDALNKPPVGNGSWFSMEVEAGKPLHTAIAGFNHLELDTIQPASSPSSNPPIPLSPNIDQAWIFFGNIGVHQTTIAPTKLTDDGAGNVTLDFSGWDVSWNGIASIPLGEGGVPEGIAQVTCYQDLVTLIAATCAYGDSFVLEYTAVVPPGDPSGFGGVPYGLHLEGVVSEFGAVVGGICINDPGNVACAYDVAVASAIDANGASLDSNIAPGTKAAAAGNTTGFGLTAAELGLPDPLMNPNDGAQCIGGCADFVISGFTTDYVDVVYKLNLPIPSDSTQLRKYIQARWGNFDGSGGNLLGSAVSVGGLCQGPEGEFRVGLRSGNECIYMRIYDGGPDDADGLKDGKVTDPSGVLLAGSPNTPSGSTSGCSISSNDTTFKDRADWLILAGFLLLFLVYRHRQANA